jgi:hypothetical protein
MLTIKNYDHMYPEINNTKQDGIFPSSIRCVVCGPSNCGKTNVMMALLIEKHGLIFENIYIYSKSLFQPKYNFLKQLMQSIPGIGYYEFNDRDNIVSPTDVKCNSIIIFDDIPVSDRNDKIKEYFAHGRHKIVDTFYICQTYAHVPKHLVRDNANLLIIFKQDGLNLKLIHRDHVNTDMTYDEFYNMCANCWRNPYGFLLINKDEQLKCGRYRSGFNHVLKI